MGERARSCKKSNNDDDFEHSICSKQFYNLFVVTKLTPFTMRYVIVVLKK